MPLSPEKLKEFQARFKHRQALFLSAVEGLLRTNSTWQIYVASEDISYDGIVTSVAVKDGQPSGDIEALSRYCDFVTGQALNLEVVADANSNLHVVSWGDLEPDWPEHLDPVLFLRWNKIKA